MGSLISSKNRTNEFDFTTMIPKVDLFSFVFWRKSTTPKNPVKQQQKNFLVIQSNMKNMDRAFLLPTRKRGFFWEKKQATLPMITFPLPSFLSDEGRSLDSSYCTLIHSAKISSILEHTGRNCFNLFQISFSD